ncbi:uncharacterized protein BT62DRAFT_734935 [Guyanagaster necrorhizus]|uniref:Secreted protein n=1 Tax=Guyanagaster necrorhizus TaxID=856835 RepID=A0A9P7VEK2_9AGAR|nr:uncharacterized protein BT62DRAFT_734935 [Guyanagaster necrorhizus MCA 3950]KAG7439483.1 hypothetical protein BT62DRAFT_734935 [Guyanagaster necrorhizus MCA 3950]
MLYNSPGSVLLVILHSILQCRSVSLSLDLLHSHPPPSNTTERAYDHRLDILRIQNTFSSIAWKSAGGLVGSRMRSTDLSSS